MSQHDFNIANQGFPSFRSDLNSALEALATLSSGATAPTSTFAHQLWVDTATDPSVLKIRNATNDAWISICSIDQTNDKITVLNATQIKVGSVTYTLPTSDGTSGQALKTNGSGVLTFGEVGATAYGLFRKADPTIVAWSKTGAFTVSTATTLYIEVNGTLHTIASSTAVTMPGSATTGTDYAIWCKTDGTLEATTNHTTPPSANARKVGGFHYAPGGNATGTSGGDTTPAINAYSFWDLKFRPACPDPRGMTLVAGGFWADIYLCGVDHYTNGTSKYNVTQADGSSPPKVPAQFGGNGTTAYSGGNWWNFGEVMRSHGKRLPTYSEFAALAYGTTEASSVGTDQVSTVLNNAYTSKWGVIQASGVLWTWGDEFGGGAAAASWTANTDGRGSTYQMENAVLFGGYWNSGSDSGSRCSLWNLSPPYSSYGVGGRGVCDHLLLD